MPQISPDSERASVHAVSFKEGTFHVPSFLFFDAVRSASEFLFGAARARNARSTGKHGFRFRFDDEPRVATGGFVKYPTTRRSL